MKGKNRYSGAASYRAKPEFESVDQLIASRKKPIVSVLDNGEIRNMAARCGLPSESVRGALRRLGFKLIQRSNGVKEWKRPTPNQIRKTASVVEAQKLSSTNTDH